MKKKFNIKDILFPTIALFLIAGVCTFILALTNSLTTGKILENAEKTKIETRKMVCPTADSFSEDKTVTVDSQQYTYNEALSQTGEIIGYVFTASDKGYGGAVTVMTGMDVDGKITGVQTIEINETAGLGMNAKKESFRGQYKGKTGPYTVSKDATTETEINALSGATITSNALTNAVNKTVEIYNHIKGGDNNG